MQSEKDLLIQSLLDIELNEREAAIYAELAIIGAQPASVLARRLNMARSSVQYTSDTLVGKGYLNKTKRNDTIYYMAAKPSLIQSKLQTEKQNYLKQAEQKEAKFQDVMASLESLNQASIHTPDVIYFEGIDNVATSYQTFYSNIPEHQQVYNYISPLPITTNARWSLQLQRNTYITSLVAVCNSNKLFPYIDNSSPHYFLTKPTLP